MNNFNNVFLAIKKHCSEKGEVNSSNCFEMIAEDAGIPVEKIDFFLNILHELQLIKYSIPEHYIKLTSFGKKQERLFSQNP